MTAIDFKRLFLNKKILVKTAIYRVITFFVGTLIFNEIIGDVTKTMTYNFYAVVAATAIYYTLEILFKYLKIRKKGKS